MTNKQIRRHSYKSYVSRTWLFLVVCVIYAMPYWLAVDVSRLTGQSWEHIITPVIAIAAYPILLGVTRFFYRGFYGERCDVKELFCYYSARNLSGAFFIGAVITGVGFAFGRTFATFPDATTYNPIWADNPAWLLFWLLLYGLALLVQFYVMFRLFLVPYVYITASEPKVFATIKESIKKTRGFFVDKVIFDISIYFIPVLLVLAVGATAVNVLGDTLFTRWIPRLINILFAPYISLCLAGFAARLLQELPRIKNPSKGSPYNRRYRYKVDWFD